QKGFAERQGSGQGTVRPRNRDAVHTRRDRTNRAGPTAPAVRGCRALPRWIGPNSSDTSRTAVGAWIAHDGRSARETKRDLVPVFPQTASFKEVSRTVPLFPRGGRPGQPLGSSRVGGALGAGPA